MITLVSALAHQIRQLVSRLRTWLAGARAAMPCARRSVVCRVGLVLATCAVLSACGGSGSATAADSPHDLTEALDRMEAPRLVPGRPAAAVYASEPAERRQITALDEPLRVQIFQAVREAAARRGVTVLPDARLDAVMDDLARAMHVNEQARSAAVDFLLSYYGVIEPYPAVYTFHTDVADDSELTRLLVELIELPTADDLVTLGIGIDRATSENRILVAVQTKLLDLAPVQRVWPSGAEIDVSGRLLGMFREPHFYVTFPSGEAQRYPIAVRQQEFRTRIRCDRGPGTYQLEVFGNDEMGTRVLANFPVYCGVEPPASYEGAAGYIPPRVTPSEAEAQLLDLVNQARRHAGLTEVTADPRLADVARGHSRDMHENGFVGHVSPTTGDPMDRVKTAGLSVARLMENVGRDNSAEAVHAGLMRSPGHRSAILDATATHVGIGVVVDAPEDGPVVLYVTELFR